MRPRAWARAVRRFRPATSRWPLVAGSSPHSMRKVVVLPAPFGPSRPKISPRATSNEVLATAVKSPKRRTRSRTTITGPSPPFLADADACAMSSARPCAIRGADAPASWCWRSIIMNASSSSSGRAWCATPPSSASSARGSASGWRIAHRAALGHRVHDQRVGVDQARLQVARGRVRRRRGGKGQAARAVRRAGAPSASRRPWCMTKTWAQRLASSM